MIGGQTEDFVPVGEAAAREGLDVDGKDDVIVGQPRPQGEGARGSVGQGRDLFGLLVKETGEEEKTVVEPLESGLALGDPPLPQQHTLLARGDRVGDELPFLEGDGSPVGGGVGEHGNGSLQF